MPNTRKLRISGGIYDNADQSIEKMTREINKELGKIVVDRDTGKNITPSNRYSYQNSSEFSAGNIFTNTTILGPTGLQLNINEQGAAYVVEEHTDLAAPIL